MPFEKGHKFAKGRPVGSKNKVTWAELCAKHDYQPGELGILAAQGKAPCVTCGGKGKTTFQPGNSKTRTMRVCQSCWGSGFERDFGKQLDADQKNVKRTYADLKALEVSGSLELTKLSDILRARKARHGNDG